jgi:hypothetical protein
MKKILFAGISSFLILSCNKEGFQKMLVLTDCTGTYLQYDGKDYHVCNPEKLDSFPPGTKVNAVVRLLEECNGSAINNNVCLKIRPSEGWVEVEKIRE